MNTTDCIADYKIGDHVCYLNYTDLGMATSGVIIKIYKRKYRGRYLDYVSIIRDFDKKIDKIEIDYIQYKKVTS